MAVDRPGDHVGNHGGAYTDIDGMRKQFTYIDHDKKTKVGFSEPPSSDWKKVYREDLIHRILDQPAALCPDIFSDFTLRGEGRKIIEWNEPMLTDEGLPIERLGEICNLVENRAESMNY